METRKATALDSLVSKEGSEDDFYKKIETDLDDIDRNTELIRRKLQHQLDKNEYEELEREVAKKNFESLEE